MAQTGGRVSQCVCPDFRIIFSAYSYVNWSQNYANVNVMLMLHNYWMDSSGSAALF